MNRSDEGMGLSVAVYALAMAFGLGLFVLPVLWANSATVYDNPAVQPSQLTGGPAYASRHGAEFPLAVLKQQQIVDPAMLAELNAKAQKAPPTHRVSRGAQQRSYAQAREVDEQRPARRPFFFSFF